MICAADGVRPDRAKIDALDYITPLTNKKDMNVFLCMMQLIADFLPN